MFTNFFKTAIRSIQKNKTYSFLNIFGLATGIACAGLIFLWVEDEMNYNAVNVKKDQLYAIANNQNFDGKVFTFNGVQSQATPGPLGPALKKEIPGIVNSCRFSWNSNTLFKVGDKAVYQAGFYTDPSVFNMFTLPFVQGNAKSAFNQMYSIVISQKMAKAFFGDDVNVVGKTLKDDNGNPYVVSGVMKDLPKNSSLHFEWLSNWAIFEKSHDFLMGWQGNSVDTYVELAPTANVAAINAKLYGFIQTKAPKQLSRAFLFSMNDWELRAGFTNGKQTGGQIEYVRLFSIIAWIVLLIACINFMNLATARSEKRAREVGVRKVLGAGKPKLIMQFIGEAIFMSVLAVAAGVVIVSLVLAPFNMLVGKQLTLGLDNPLHIGALVAIALICGLVAGSYPALYLSSFNPVFVFKGMKIKNGSAALVRKGLVVLQFTVSIVLIISTIIIYQQVQHIKNRSLGYNKNNLLTMPIRGNMIGDYSVIKHDLLGSGVVENTALNSMNTLYTGDNGPSNMLSWAGKNPNANALVSFRSVSPDFIATAGMQLAAGRDFINEKTDSMNVLITQAFEKLMGTGSAVGKTITFQTYNWHVVGVVKDFVYGDMYGSPDPVLFACNPPQASLLYVRIKQDQNTEQALAKIEAVMKKDNAAYPFEYTFLDEQFNQLFSSEMLIGKLSRIFAALAIIISCLGLFGLAAYTAERRTKEIGIRKVLGASITSVTSLLSKEFIQLVFISSLIAFPVAWLAMNKWLEGYAYHITISWVVFAVAGFTAMLIALATISFQSIKAGLMNPVKSLRTE